MRIERVEIWQVRFPLPRPFYPSWIPGYPQRENRFDLIRIFCADGTSGISAVPAMSMERSGLGTILGPYLIGLNPENLEELTQRLRELSYLGLRNYWIEPAFWDIRGKLQGCPVYRFFGGKPGRIRLYASLGEHLTPSTLIPLIERIANQGFSVVKLRVHGLNFEEDSAILREVTRAFQGSGIQFAVDANQGWRVEIADPAPKWDLLRAFKFARLCEELRILWLEEPMAMEEHRALRWLQESSRIPIAGGELQRGGAEELLRMIEMGCYTIYQPDATLVEGIGGSLRVMAKALAYGYRFTPHTWTNGIGFAINLQVFASHPRRTEELLEYPFHPPSWLPEYRDAILKTPFLHEKGELELPQTPGLGIELDEKALRRYGKRIFTITLIRVAVRMIREHGLRTTLDLYQKRRARLLKGGDSQ